MTNTSHDIALASNRDGSLQNPPVLDIDPYAEDILADPRPFHDALRDIASVVWLPKYGIYATGRYEETRIVMSDSERFSTSAGLGMSDIRKPDAWRPRSPIAEIDPPEHTKVRLVLNRIISPLVIRGWREKFTKEAERVADEAVAKREIDAVTDIIENFIVTVLPDAVGVKMPREYYLPLGDLNFNQIGPNNELVKKATERAAHILPKYEKFFSRESVLSGGIAEKIYDAEDAGELAAGTGGPHVRTFLRAGVDTTVAGIGHTLHSLAKHPDAWTAIRRDPAMIKRAFEEAIRLETPSQTHFRMVMKDGTELGGFRLKPQVKIIAFLGAGNADPRRWKDPMKFDITRDVSGGHLAFGAGAHICAGQMIARLEIDCLMNALAKRVARLEILETPRRRPNNVLNTLESLKLRLIPG